MKRTSQKTPPSPRDSYVFDPRSEYRIKENNDTVYCRAATAAARGARSTQNFFPSGDGGGVTNNKKKKKIYKTLTRFILHPPAFSPTSSSRCSDSVQYPIFKYFGSGGEGNRGSGVITPLNRTFAVQWRRHRISARPYINRERAFADRACSGFLALISFTLHY